MTDTDETYWIRQCISIARSAGNVDAAREADEELNRLAGATRVQGWAAKGQHFWRVIEADETVAALEQRHGSLEGFKRATLLVHGS